MFKGINDIRQLAIPTLQLLQSDLKVPQMSQQDQSLGFNAKESQLLYAGYLYITLVEKKAIQPADQLEFLRLFGKRVVASSLPSCIKSFVLPIAH